MLRMILLLICLGNLFPLEAQTITSVRRLCWYERYDSATRDLQTLLRSNPNDNEAWWLYTLVRLRDDDSTGATTNVTRYASLKDSLATQVNASNHAPLALVAYGNILLHQGRKDSAAILFSQAVTETREKDPLVLLAAATAQVESRNGDPVVAIDLVQKAIKKDKHNPEAYIILGNAYRRLQNGTEAYKAYQAAIDQDQHYAPAMYKMGKLFLAQANADMYVKYFTDAVSADPQYAPAWYELYYYYYFRDVNKAMDCLQHYIAASDKSIRNDYLVTDLLYASRKYKEAIANATPLLGKEPRIAKLIAYSWKELGDSAAALNYMHRYFVEQKDSGFVVKDYETLGDIYTKFPAKMDSAALAYSHAAAMVKDSADKIAYSRKLADIYKQLKDYPNQAYWLGQYYQGNPHVNNLDLFNWGLAGYMAKDYTLADSVFGLYETKYPDQNFGFYWRARSDAAIDTAMTTGKAIPHYLKYIDLTTDTTNTANRRHLIESYGYIAAYKANTEKDYAAAIAWFDRLLALDPGNSDAKKYVEILRKNLNKAGAKGETSKTDKP